MTLTKERHEDHEGIQAECPWCYVVADTYIRTGFGGYSGDVTVRCINRDSVYYGVTGTLMAVHEDSGTHMMIPDGWLDMSIPFAASEIAIVNPDVVPESEARAMWGDR